jgi:hypothetical protein
MKSTSTTVHAEGGEPAKPVLKSILTCPHCGFAREETMMLDACLFFKECWRCGAVLRPKPGDCCVFCSFGSVKCPPVQMHNG